MQSPGPVPLSSAPDRPAFVSRGRREGLWAPRLVGARGERGQRGELRGGKVGKERAGRPEGYTRAATPGQPGPLPPFLSGHGQESV